MTNFKINLPETFKLQLDLTESKILVYNKSRSIVHEMDATNIPEIVDYIKSDSRHNGLKTFVHGFIEDNLLVVVHRSDGDW